MAEQSIHSRHNSASASGLSSASLTGSSFAITDLDDEPLPESSLGTYSRLGKGQGVCKCDCRREGDNMIPDSLTVQFENQHLELQTRGFRQNPSQKTFGPNDLPHDLFHSDQDVPQEFVTDDFYRSRSDTRSCNLRDLPTPIKLRASCDRCGEKRII